MSAVVYVANTTICTLFTSTSVAKTTAYFMVNHLLLAKLYSSADRRRRRRRHARPARPCGTSSSGNISILSVKLNGSVLHTLKQPKMQQIFTASYFFFNPCLMPQAKMYLCNCILELVIDQILTRILINRRTSNKIHCQRKGCKISRRDFIKIETGLFKPGLVLTIFETFESIHRYVESQSKFLNQTD